MNNYNCKTLHQKEFSSNLESSLKHKILLKANQDNIQENQRQFQKLYQAHHHSRLQEYSSDSKLALKRSSYSKEAGDYKQSESALRFLNNAFCIIQKEERKASQRRKLTSVQKNRLALNYVKFRQTGNNFHDDSDKSQTNLLMNSFANYSNKGIINDRGRSSEFIRTRNLHSFYGNRQGSMSLQKRKPLNQTQEYTSSVSASRKEMNKTQHSFTTNLNISNVFMNPKQDNNSEIMIQNQTMNVIQEQPKKKIILLQTFFKQKNIYQKTTKIKNRLQSIKDKCYTALINQKNADLSNQAQKNQDMMNFTQKSRKSIKEYQSSGTINPYSDEQQERAEDLIQFKVQHLKRDCGDASSIDKALEKLDEFEKSQNLYKRSLKEMSAKIKELNCKRSLRIRNKYEQ